MSFDVNQFFKMGLGIIFYFEDGTEKYVSMCYSSFSRYVMTYEDMVEWHFTDHDGTYTGAALDFLIERLVISEYLEKPFNPKPFKAIFC